MKYKTTNFVSVLLVGVFGFSVLFHSFTIGKKDREKYENLSQETELLCSSAALERNPASQVKVDVQKDIWLTKSDKREHFQMFSEAAETFFQQKKGKFQAQEKLEKITCSSSFGEILAKTGTYQYPEYRFIADEVECFHPLGTLRAKSGEFENKTKGHFQLNGKVTLTSRRGDVDLSIQSKRAVLDSNEKGISSLKEQAIEFFEDVEIQAGENTYAKGEKSIYKEGMLTLFPGKAPFSCYVLTDTSRVDAKEIHFDLSQETISCFDSQGYIGLEEDPIFFSGQAFFWEKKTGTFLLSKSAQIEKGGSFLIQADEASVCVVDNTPKTTTLKGNVHLFSKNIQNKETFALADYVNMNLEEKKIVLTAKEPSRVLFWQDGARISAPEVHVFKDSLTDKEIVEGKGDIRFTFNSTEESVVQQFLSKYL